MVAPGWAKRVPPSASVRPAAILSKVDLPEPLRPTRHSRSPAPTLSSAPSSRRWPPNETTISLRCKSGFIRRYVLAMTPLGKPRLAGFGRHHGARTRFHLQNGFGTLRHRLAVESKGPDIAFHRALHQQTFSIVAPHRTLAGMAQLRIRDMGQRAF